MPKVIIDGVEYIPAKDVLVNEMAIAKGLLTYYWGVCDDKRAMELINDPCIRVYVNDSGDGESLRDVLNTIAKQQA